MSPHILIEPGELRRAARTYREVGTSLGGLRTGLRTPLPDMPGGLRARAQQEIEDAVRDIGEQIDYIGEEATALERRATWAEKADRGGWMALLSVFDLFGLGGVPALSDRFGKPSRPDLDSVLDDYQVADDETRDWEPPWPFSMATDAENLTSKEIEMLETLSILNLKDFSGVRDKAFDESSGRYGGKTLRETNDGHEDAFRHAYWNALLVKEFGPDFARKFATAHEGRPGNPGTREAMDLYNNEVGRQIAIDHPDADGDELARLVQEAVDDGNVVVIDRDSDLAYSDQVPVGQHGETDGRPHGGGKPAEGAESDDYSEGTGS